MTAREYLETALRSVSGSSNAAQAKNQVRFQYKKCTCSGLMPAHCSMRVENLQGAKGKSCLCGCSLALHRVHSHHLADLQIRDSIKALFPDRDCLTLVRPMADEKMLAKLETVDSAQFRPEFQEVCSFRLFKLPTQPCTASSIVYV